MCTHCQPSWSYQLFVERVLKYFVEFLWVTFKQKVLHICFCDESLLLLLPFLFYWCSESVDPPQIIASIYSDPCEKRRIVKDDLFKGKDMACGSTSSFHNRIRRTVILWAACDQIQGLSNSCRVPCRCEPVVPGRSRTISSRLATPALCTSNAGSTALTQNHRFFACSPLFS